MEGEKTNADHSFAVMAYKDSPFLGACLESLKKQSVNSTIYITTSTPSDYISKIASDYGVDLFVTDSKKGIGHDWNFSMQQAKTKYVTLAHQDDLYYPEYTAQCLRASEKYPDTLICCTDCDESANEKIRTHTALLITKKIMLGFFTPLKNNVCSRMIKRRLLSAGNPIAAPSVMYNLKNLPGFQFSNHYSINLDWEAWYRMAEMKGCFVYLNNILMTHRIHAGSATTEGLKANVRQKEDLEMFQLFWPRWIAKQVARIYAASYKSNDANS